MPRYGMTFTVTKTFDIEVEANSPEEAEEIIIGMSDPESSSDCWESYDGVEWGRAVEVS